MTLVSLVIGFRTMIFDHAPTAFSAPEEDMSFAWFVPVFSLYVLWTERASIARHAGKGEWLGTLATLPCIALGFLGVRGIQLRFEQLAFIGLLVSLPWAFYGRRLARRILFPALFLLFCIPLNSFLDIVTVHLRIFATSTAYILLKGLGVDVVAKGTMMFSGDGAFAIDVAQPCSGIRSIFALMALTAGYAYFTQKTFIGKLLLFALSLPIAVLGNIARIMTICAVGIVADHDFALGFYHDYSGYVVFAVAIAAMVGAGTLVSRFFPGRDADVSGSSAPAADGDTAESGVVPARSSETLRNIVTTLVVTGAMVCLSVSPEASLCEPAKVVFPEIGAMTPTIVPPSEAEMETLPEDTIIEKRSYASSDGSFLVSAITGGRSKRSIHRPELCLPSQGFSMSDPRTVAVGGRKWRVISIESSQSGKILFAYTFFNQEGYRTPSHTARIFRDVLDRTLYNRIDRWTMLTVNAMDVDEAGLTAFLKLIGGANE